MRSFCNLYYYEVKLHITYVLNILYEYETFSLSKNTLIDFKREINKTLPHSLDTKPLKMSRVDDTLCSCCRISPPALKLRTSLATGSYSATFWPTLCSPASTRRRHTGPLRSSPPSAAVPPRPDALQMWAGAAPSRPGGALGASSVMSR